MTAMFGKKEKGQSAQKAEKETVKKTDTKSGVKKTEKKKVKKVSEKLIQKADLVNKVVLSPVISEDAMNKTTEGKYVFKINQKANKNQVAESIEALYGVEVTKVNVMKYKQKNHRFRLTKGKKAGFKKAIVTIKSGQEIKLFSESK